MNSAIGPPDLQARAPSTIAGNRHNKKKQITKKHRVMKKEYTLRQFPSGRFRSTFRPGEKYGATPISSSATGITFSFLRREGRGAKKEQSQNHDEERLGLR